MMNVNFRFGEAVYNGGTEYRFHAYFEYSKSDRTAIVLYRPSDGTYVVGKNFEVTGPHSVSWCWGNYDFHDCDDAYTVARAWVFSK